MSEKNYEKYTFWELINNYKIEIPIIQRDYAQGREDKRTTLVRENFISVLYEMIKDKDKDKDNSTDLDFIYGTVDNGKFIPLDGQQRLTTLFLIHWYIAAKENKLDKKQKELFNKFSYKTRNSSRDFCDSLINNGISFTNEDKMLSELIEDCNWFYLSWKKDPTVKSMLVMLDTIHERFSNPVNEKLKKVTDEEILWNKLIDIDKPPITFQFLEIKNFGLSDDLYIKMNSRGKQLTDYENFKSWLEEQIIAKPKETPTFKEYFFLQLDTKWADLFWKYKDGENFLIDEEYMRFFNGMALFRCIEMNENQENNVDLKNIITEFTAKSSNDEIYIPLRRYEELKCFDEVSLNNCFIVLESLKEGRNECITKSLKESEKTGLTFFIDEKSLFEAFITGDITLSDRLLFYALIQFLIKHSPYNSNCNQDHLKSWMRVMRNLIVNTPLSNDNFPRIVLSIKKLAEKCNNIYDNLSKFEGKDISAFNEYQIKEEIVKAKLGKITEEKLLAVENHKYFSGQIGFLLCFAGCDFINQNIENFNIDDFNNYSEIAKIIFSDKGLIESKEFLFQRALLTYGDYTLDIGQNKSFCESKNTWRRLFREYIIYNNRYQNKYEILKKIFKDSSDKLKEISSENLKAFFEVLIQNNNVENNNWRKYFIEDPIFFSECGLYKLIREFHGTFMLLGKSNISSYHSEIRTFYLYLKFRKDNNINDRVYIATDIDQSYNLAPFSLIRYFHTNISSVFPRIGFIWPNNDIWYELDLLFKDEKYKVNFLKFEKNGYHPKEINDDKIKDFLVRNNFISNRPQYSKNLSSDNEEDVFKEIKILCNSFNELVRLLPQV